MSQILSPEFYLSSLLLEEAISTWFFLQLLGYMLEVR